VTGSLSEAIRVSVMCTLDKSGAGVRAAGFGVENETLAAERLLGLGVGLGDGSGVSRPATLVGDGEAMIRFARGLWWLHDAATTASTTAAALRPRRCTRL
jgi:hypothetical protein